MDNSCKYWIFIWFERGFSFQPVSCKIWPVCACVHIRNRNAISAVEYYFFFCIIQYWSSIFQVIGIICAWYHSIIKLDKLGVEPKIRSGWWDALWLRYMRILGNLVCMSGLIFPTLALALGLLATKFRQARICTQPVCCTTTVHAISWRAILWIAFPTIILSMQR